jgi:hypothetical protein
MLFMAGFTAIMEGNAQLIDPSFAFRGIVAGAALLDGLALLPDVSAVAVFVVTLVACLHVAIGMLRMGKPYGSLPIGFIDLVVDDDFSGHFLCFTGA